METASTRTVQNLLEEHFAGRTVTVRLVRGGRDSADGMGLVRGGPANSRPAGGAVDIRARLVQQAPGGCGKADSVGRTGRRGGFP